MGPVSGCKRSYFDLTQNHSEDVQPNWSFEGDYRVSFAFEKVCGLFRHRAAQVTSMSMPTTRAISDRSASWASIVARVRHAIDAIM